jgi:hypothetical protein
MHSYNFKSLNSSKYKLDLNILLPFNHHFFSLLQLFENNYVQGSDDEPTKIITILILIVVYYFFKISK